MQCIFEVKFNLGDCSTDMGKQICSHCSECLPTPIDLRMHVLKFHPIHINDVTSSPLSKKNYTCQKCSSEFQTERGLNRHIRKAHVEDIEETVFHISKNDLPPKTWHKCPECKFTGTNLDSYRTHMRKYHAKLAEELCPKSRIPYHDKKCPLCSFKSKSRSEMLNHFTEDHHIKLHQKYFNFANLTQFYEWKSMMEKDTTCHYVQNSKSVTKNGKRTVYRYLCHRTGYYRDHGKGSKKMKHAGSNKINGFCPSEILVTVDDVSCEVNFLKTHIGHSNEIQRMCLTSEERDYIAKKIANKIPFDKIVEEVRSAAVKSDMSLDRLQLLSRKDLFNIARQYNLKQSVVLRDDRDIDTWVEETEGVLFYKAEGRECNDHPFLSKEDFVLIIMNSKQKEIFESSSHDLICIDSLAGANDHFDLTTIMVRDDALCGFPCAFMFSNRADDCVMEFYFSLLKEKLGTVKAKALMTDVTDLHYSTWSKIMAKPERRLYCSWDIDKAWRARLAKIKSTEIRKLTYTLLKNLQTESVEQKYRKLLQDLLNNEIIDTEFRASFAESFALCEQSWACCFRVEDRINEDTQLQQVHEHLKYLCTYGKNLKPLQHILSIVMRMVGDNLVIRRVILNSNDTLYHLNVIQKRHRDSYLGNFDSIITVSEGWHVPSFDELGESPELYFVQQVLKKCGCNYVCSECRTCIHQFTCTCGDNSIEGIMCKHIHLVIRYRDGKKYFILDEESGKFKDIDSDEEVNKEDTPETKTSEQTNRNETPIVTNQINIRDVDLSIFGKLISKGTKVSKRRRAKKVETKIEYSQDDREMFSIPECELGNEEPVDNVIDTDTLESSQMPVAAQLHSSQSEIQSSVFPENIANLEKEKVILVDQFNDRIKRISSLKQILALQNILLQIDKILEHP